MLELISIKCKLLIIIMRLSGKLNGLKRDNFSKLKV
jgi:hypothetical protein